MREPGLRVFLSHTAELRRFPRERSFVDAVEDAVRRAGHVPVDTAALGGESPPPVQVCRRAVESTDVYVAVLGFRYGPTVPAYEEMSYTELELEAAQRAGKPLLVFMLDDATPGNRDLLVDLEHGRRQEAFRRRVADANLTRGVASTPDALALLVTQALTALEPEGSTRGGADSRVWRVPPRSQVFVGREDVLASLHSSLASGTGDGTLVRALHGMGGVGKTALAIEYAHRYAADYDLVWWVPSEDPDIVPASLAELAHSLGLAAVGDPVAVALGRLQAYLRRRDRWLICYDNAEEPAALRGSLCTGPGHVLITSRSSDWAGVGTTIELDVLDHDDGVELVRSRARRLTVPDAHRVAEALGHLPLALTQAGAYLAETPVDADTYLQLLDARVGEVMARGRALDYPVSFAASWELTFDRLAQEAPAALQLLEVAAHLAPEPIPFTLFTAHPELAPEPLASACADPLVFTDLVAHLRRHALARVDADSLQVHRLVQAHLRHRAAATVASAGTPADTAAELVGAGVPRRSWNAYETWPAWAVLLPHVLAVATGPYARADDELACSLLDRAAVYLHTRGEPWRALPLARQARTLAARQFGADAPLTLTLTSNLAAITATLGEYETARALDADTLERRRRVLGEEHPATLGTANNLAVVLSDLGEFDEARRLGEDTLDKRRRALGADHPVTLGSASNLAAVVSALGEHEAARELGEDTLRRYRRVLGEDHPDTLAAAGNLATELRAEARYADARALMEDTVVRRRRILGEDHPDALRSAVHLVGILFALGEHEAARELGEDTLRRYRRVLGDDHPDTLAVARILDDGPAGTAGSRPAERLVSHEDADDPESALGVTDALLMRAFAVAGHALRVLDEGVLVSGDDRVAVVHGPRARFDRLAEHAPPGSSVFVVDGDERALGDDPRLDDLRVRGCVLTTVSSNVLEAALNDGAVSTLIHDLREEAARVNPFDTRTALVDEKSFFGRRALLADLARLTARGESVLLTGFRKVGKTSLLNVFRQRRVDIPVCKVDLQLFDRTREDWPSELFRLVLRSFDSWATQHRPNWRSDPCPGYLSGTDLREGLAQRCTRFDPGGSGPRLLLLLDEVERVFPGEGETAALSNWLRASQTLRAVAQSDQRIVIAAADLRPVANRRNLMTQTASGESATNPLFDFFHEITVPMFDPEATREMVVTLARAMNIDAGDAFVSGLQTLTGGHPSFARSIAAEATGDRAGGDRLDGDDLRAAVERKLEDGSIDAFLQSNIWAPMSPGEKDVTLRAAAGERVTPAAGPAGSVARQALATLTGQRMLVDGRLEMGLLTQWLQEQEWGR